MNFWSFLGLVDKNEILRLDSKINSLKDENELLHQQNYKLLKDMEQNQKINNANVISEISNNREQMKVLLQNNNNCIEQLVDIITGFQEKSILSHVHIVEQIKECIDMLNTNKSVIDKQSNEIKKIVESEGGRNRRQIEERNEEVLETINSCSQMNAQEKVKTLKEIKKYFDDINSSLDKIQEYMNLSYTYLSDDSELIKDNKKKMEEILSLSQKINKKTENVNDIQEYLMLLSESINYLGTITKAVWVDSILTDIDSLK